MDSGERDGSSNSPNDRTITDIRRGAGGRIEVRFSDGSSFFARTDTVAALGLGVGMSFDLDQYHALARRIERTAAVSRALSLLATREHSRFQLERKLERRGFSPQAISEALDHLEDGGALDDSRFANAWVESRIRKHPEGSAMLVKRLREMGVSAAVSQAAVTALLGDSQDEQIIEDAARQIMKRSGMTREKLMRALSSRGFPVSQIYRAADRWFSARDDTE